MSKRGVGKLTRYNIEIKFGDDWQRYDDQDDLETAYIRAKLYSKSGFQCRIWDRFEKEYIRTAKKKI